MKVFFIRRSYISKVFRGHFIFLIMLCSRSLSLFIFNVLAFLGVAHAERMPEFSWDTVPRYMHLRKSTQLTQKEVDYLATFPLVTFEKAMGTRTFGSVEKGTLNAAQAVKKVNPKTKILYYRNILVHYSGYDTNKSFNKISEGLLKNKSGFKKLVRGKVGAYDLSLPEVQDWWLKHTQKMCAEEGIDGVFIDGNIKALEPGYLRSEIGVQKRAAVTKSYHEMIEKLPEMMEPEDLIVANIIRARFDDSGLSCLKYFDGSYIEGFETAVKGMSREDYMVKGIEAVQKAARAGNIIAFTIGMGKSKSSKLSIDESRARAESFEAIEERFRYTLALFLVCAEKYSYFLPSDTYGIDDKAKSLLWMLDIPEYSKPLGKPSGPAVKDGYVYRRSFEHVDVMVDLVSQKGELTWRE